MRDKNWLKWMLYIICTAACAFAGYLIYFAAKNGTLYSGLFENFKIKALILGIPFVICIIIDMLYPPDEIMDVATWKNSLGTHFPAYSLAIL